SAPMIVWFFHAKVGHCQTPIQKTPDYSGVFALPGKNVGDGGTASVRRPVGFAEERLETLGYSF
ncbi:TPA: hypothetical protein ACM25J_002271, partial [Neisseria meningitidis]|nr:hypothetical protein [Neisseria meningitidis]MCL5909320.1 hypothetical protein [Neisseria meningitidis]MCL6083911.1 hypothetical protein [Neisseria meningitidis]